MTNIGGFCFCRDVGGGNALDSLESFELNSEEVKNFVLHDNVSPDQNEEEQNEWKFRLPWPLIDVTSVKIPVMLL